MELKDKTKKVLPAEWAPQSAVMLTWPHSNTDWQPILPQVTDTYVKMAREIAKRERLVIVTPEPNKVRQLLPHSPRITFVKCDTNDTWARDHGFITLVNRDQQNPFSGHQLLDFRFNGWGDKFEAQLDPENGDLAVCCLDGEFTLKRIEITPDRRLLLMPSNRNYQPIEVTEDNEFMVWGIVVYTIKANRRRRKI